MASKPVAHEHCKNCGACLTGPKHKCLYPERDELTEREIDIIDSFLALTARGDQNK